LILIFEQYRTFFGERLYKATEERGLPSLWLTSDEIIKDLVISFYLENNKTNIVFSYGSLSFTSTDLKGVYSAIDYFPSDLFEFVSKKDREYAAMEWHALWLSMLSVLQCKVVNPPAVDALGGAVFTPVEIFDKARKCGFDIPTILEVESGKVASQFADYGAYLTYTDLGEDILLEKKIDKKKLLEQPLSEHHIRIREYLPAKIACISVIGSKIFMTYINGKDTHLEIPDTIAKSLLKLHKDMNLIIAEYFFSIIKEKEWIFYDVKRTLSKESLDTHGEKLIFEAINVIRGE